MGVKPVVEKFQFFSILHLDWAGNLLYMTKLLLSWFHPQLTAATPAGTNTNNFCQGENKDLQI